MSHVTLEQTSQRSFQEIALASRKRLPAINIWPRQDINANQSSIKINSYPKTMISTNLETNFQKKQNTSQKTNNYMNHCEELVEVKKDNKSNSKNQYQKPKRPISPDFTQKLIHCCQCLFYCFLHKQIHHQLSKEQEKEKKKRIRDNYKFLTLHELQQKRKKQLFEQPIQNNLGSIRDIKPYLSYNALIRTNWLCECELEETGRQIQHGKQEKKGTKPHSGGKKSSSSDEKTGDKSLTKKIQKKANRNFGKRNQQRQNKKQQAQAVRQKICHCNINQCKKDICGCFKRGVKCTSLCVCSNCKNITVAFSNYQKQQYQDNLANQKEIIKGANEIQLPVGEFKKFNFQQSGSQTEDKSKRDTSTAETSQRNGNQKHNGADLNMIKQGEIDKIDQQLINPVPDSQKNQSSIEIKDPSKDQIEFIKLCQTITPLKMSDNLRQSKRHLDRGLIVRVIAKQKNCLEVLNQGENRMDNTKNNNIQNPTAIFVSSSSSDQNPVVYNTQSNQEEFIDKCLNFNIKNTQKYKNTPTINESLEYV